jgi:hypothetical protein
MAHKRLSSLTVVPKDIAILAFHLKAGLAAADLLDTKGLIEQPYGQSLPYRS